MDTRFVIIFTVIQLSVFNTKAVAQSWGSGVYGANQVCPYAAPAQPPAAPPVDQELVGLRQQQAVLKSGHRDLARQLKELEEKSQAYSDSIASVVKSDWLDAVTEHLENGGSCGCERESGLRPIGAPPGDFPERPPGGRPMGPRDFNGPPPARMGNSISDASDIRRKVRSPANQDERRENQFDRQWNAVSASPADQSCGLDELHSSKPWKAICTRTGFTKSLCHNRFFANGNTKGSEIRDCDKALANYGATQRAVVQIQAQIDQNKNQLAALSSEIKQHLSQVAATSQYAAQMMGPNAGNSGPSYQNGSYGYPFMQAGNYGGIAGGQTGSMGCTSNNMSPGFQNGSNAMMSGNNGGMSPFGMNPASMNGQGIGSLGASSPYGSGSLFGGLSGQFGSGAGSGFGMVNQNYGSSGYPSIYSGSSTPGQQNSLGSYSPLNYRLGQSSSAGVPSLGLMGGSRMYSTQIRR